MSDREFEWFWCFVHTAERLLACMLMVVVREMVPFWRLDWFRLEGAGGSVYVSVWGGGIEGWEPEACMGKCVWKLDVAQGCAEPVLCLELIMCPGVCQ